MIRLVPKPAVTEWMVFFCDAGRYAWWDIFTRRGFRHVAAAACDPGKRVWIMFDPTRAGIRFDVYGWDDPSVDERLGEWLHWSDGRYLRVKTGGQRKRQPLFFGCIGALKALLGVRCGAFTPYGVFKHLIAQGAEIVHVEPVQQTGHSAGRPVDYAATRDRAAAGRGCQDQGDAGSATPADAVEYAEVRHPLAV